MSEKKLIIQPLFDNLNNWPKIEELSLANSAILYPEDFKHASSFLYSYRGSQATFSAYRREIERFLQWCWHIANVSIKNIKRADIEDFINFCKNPDLSWIGVKHYARFVIEQGIRIPNKRWRPFVATVRKSDTMDGKVATKDNYCISEKAMQAIFAILSSFYNYLIQENYLSHNPVMQIRQKNRYFRKQQKQRINRRFTELQWSYIIETAEIMASSEPDKHERTLFIMNALFSMYLRISELAASPRWQPQMGDFKRDIDGNWWFTTVGKGNKQRDIAVSDSMLSALKRYRQYLDLSLLPSPGETRPLIKKTIGQGSITSTRQIRSIVQNCFDIAIDRLREDGFDEDAEQMKAATVHWLRHTGISEDVKHRPREHVRDDAGHSSSMITDKYVDIEKRQRHASARKKLIKPDL